METEISERLTILKNKRRSIKGLKTRLLNYFNKLDLNNLDDITVNELSSRLEKLEPLWDEFNDVQTEIENLCNQDSEDITERQEFEDSYFSLIGKIKSACNSYNNDQNSVKSESSRHSINNANSLDSFVKLPPIEIPTFNGNYNDWLDFKEIFLSLVDKNAGLLDSQKLYYLRSSLSKEPLKLIQSIAISADNYKVAWDLLLDRYENKHVIVHSHIRSIFEYPVIKKESHIELRHLFDNIKKHLHALNSMGEATQYWDRLIIYIVSNKFDAKTKRDWESYKYPGDLPTWSDMTNFLKNKCEILERLEVSKLPERFGKGNSGSYYTSTEDQPKDQCFNCKGNHTLNACELFLKLNVSDKIACVKKLKLCLNCMRPSHPFWKCRSPRCSKCKKPHNILLHIENVSVANKNNYIPSQQTVSIPATGKSDEQLPLPGGEGTRGTAGAAAPDGEKSITTHSRTDGSVASFQVNSQILLSTALIKVFHGDKVVLCRCLLDSGSQSHFISESLCNKLNLKPVKVNHTVRGVGMALSNISNQVSVFIGSRYNKFKVKLNCLVLPRITERLPLSSFDKESLSIPNYLQLADPEFNVPGNIDMLLGSDVFWNILCTGQQHLGKNLPVLQNSELGWIVAGNLYLSSNSQNLVSVTNLSINKETSLDSVICKFWELEEVSTNKKIMSENEIFCENHFKMNCKRDKLGRFVVKMPFKESVKDLGESKNMALKRFQSLERKLCKVPELKVDYVNFMKEYEGLGHMKEIILNNDDFEGYFLPHHAVIKNSSLTTKCRVVFDASAKSSTGLSLNDVQYAGPTLQQDIFSILLRFRKHTYVIIADVSKMYRQVIMDPSQTKYLRIFWRSEPEEVLKCYELQTVTYGTASAPFLAVRCLIELAYKCKDNFPIASKIIANDFYMDDLLTGADTVIDILKLQKDITNILSTAGFKLRKWQSNDKDILKKLEIDERLDVNVLPIAEGEQNKTLGIFWNPQNDNIQYIINDIPKNAVVTKRAILSVICQIFDPLGLLGPIIIVAKLIVQELWRLKINWDEPVPSKIYERWCNFIKYLPVINSFIIPRHVCISHYVTIELHGFSDSSELAYGACLYARCIDASGRIFINLLCAKSRVAPLKKISLPRLELCGAVLLANLAQKTCISLEINFNRKYWWCDSMITLCWIKGETSRWKTFVANRVSEINSLTNTNDWFYVKSSENPADLLSRGTFPDVLKNNDLWWQGPNWFYTDISSRVLDIVPEDFDVPEQKICNLVTATDDDNFIKKLLVKHSSLNKIQRIVVYVVRFTKILKSKDRLSGPLKAIELDDAFNLIILTVQKECFAKDYKCLEQRIPLVKNSNIMSLNPFMFNNLIRVGGRIKHSSYCFDKKHPILLPKNNILTDLILRQEHHRLFHCGSQLLLCSIREKFWIISGRSCCKKIVRNCVVCIKAKPSNSKYLMGDLPTSRVDSYLPFLNVGVDYGGPFILKDRKGRGAKTFKAYLCLFVCMCTKAVHLELVTSLSTEAFLATLRRFVSRRGKPANIYSDNGSNFIGANNELTRIYDFLKENSQYICDQLASERVCWHFIPPRSPNFGGIWEAGVKGVKYHLKRVLGDIPYTFEDYITILYQIEAILNSRPLCPLSTDPEDLSALTPAHMLIGRSLTALPDYSVLDVPQNRLVSYQQLQSIVQHFWARWRKEYVGELQNRTKWRENLSNIKLGALVLVKNENAAVQNWVLGRIIGLCPGKDNVVRVVDIKTIKGTIRRSLNSVCCLPIE